MDGANGGQDLTIATAKGLPSTVGYDFTLSGDDHGVAALEELGCGIFARVYRGRQHCANRAVRRVAIKVLRPEATYKDELLFAQEIELLRSLSETDSVHVIHLLDVLHLPPMALCGCGNIYQPLCPRGCQQVLVRKEEPHHDGRERQRPMLACPSCSYELPGNELNQRTAELLSPPAKPCCRSGAQATGGRLINFVNRDALVMEEIGARLEQFVTERSKKLEILRERKGGAPRPESQPTQPPAQRRRPRPWQRLRELWQRDRDEVILQKVLLLEKVQLMKQIAEAVAWLHASRRIIHKDLALDNVMVRCRDGSDWRGDLASGVSLRDLLNNLASNPPFHVELIDFGLADREQPSRSWYQDGAAQGYKKVPFLSPEARHDRKQAISPGDVIFFDPEASRFKIPEALQASLRPGDVLADPRDFNRRYDLTIVKVELPYAYYQGEPRQDDQRFELIRPLCEPHDVYAVGALFYFILVENTYKPEALQSFADTLTRERFAINPEALWQRDGYLALRGEIKHRYWRDELMVLILRAMTRGLDESFATDRIQRGPEPAQTLLHETERLYHQMQRDVLSSHGSRWRLLRNAGVTAALVGLAAGGVTYGVVQKRGDKEELKDKIERLGHAVFKSKTQEQTITSLKETLATTEASLRSLQAAQGSGVNELQKTIDERNKQIKDLKSEIRGLEKQLVKAAQPTPKPSTSSPRGR